MSATAELPIYIAAPEGEPRGAVIVAQEAFGINDHIRDICHRLAAEGYLAAAPHLFHRVGDPVIDYGDLETAMKYVGGLDAAELETDIDATLVHLAGEGFPEARTAIVGFCMGGAVSFVAGVRHPLAAAVSFYGGGIRQGRFGEPPLLELAPQLRTPWLGLYGEEDHGIPLEQAVELRDAAGRADVPTELVTYPGAGHGFHCDVRDAYEPTTAADAWKRTLAFFAEHISAAPTRGA
jgi:carboxymethylenebutenolidase